MPNSDKVLIKSWDKFSREYKNPQVTQALEVGAVNDELLIRMINTNEITLSKDEAATFIAKTASIFRRIWPDD